MMWLSAPARWSVDGPAVTLNARRLRLSLTPLLLVCALLSWIAVSLACRHAWIALKKLDRLQTAGVSLTPANRAANMSAASLPGRATSNETILREIERAANGAGILNVATSVASAAVEGRWQRTEITARLTGSYPNIKRALKEVLEHYPQISLSRLQLTKADATSDAQLEAMWVLNSWSQS